MRLLFSLALVSFALADDTYELKLKLEEGKKFTASYKGAFVTEEKEKREGKPEELMSRQVLNFELESVWEVKKIAAGVGEVDETPREVFLRWDLQKGTITLKFKDGKFEKDEYTGDESLKEQKEEAKSSISANKTVQRRITETGAVVDPAPTTSTTINMPAFLPSKPVKVDENWQIKDGEVTLNCKLLKVEKKDKTYATIRVVYSHEGKTQNVEEKLERDVEVLFCVEEGMFARYNERYTASTAGEHLGATVKSSLTAAIEVALKPK